MAPVQAAPPDEGHHRDVTGGAARAAVFGVSDGLVSNMGLILGVAGADPAPAVVRLAGMAGLVAGAISMAAGEFNSMQVQTELLRRELSIEAAELDRRPQHETDELARVYEARGLPPGQAHDVAEALMRDPDAALQAHAREELGIDPERLGSPWGAATSSFVAGGRAATVASLILGVIAAVLVGALIAGSTGRPPSRAIVRQVLFTVVPAA